VRLAELPEGDVSETTAIEWTHHTFNPWWGCTKVSPGCTHCYAESFAKRTGHAVWGAGVPRRFFGDKHWAEPLKWNADAMRAGERRRVFCASMADVFEADGALVAHRERLWRLIGCTPHLDWLLLTKRPENAEGMAPWRGRWPENVWLGTSVENAEHGIPRVTTLRNIDGPRIRFLSIEPLLEDLGWVVLRRIDWAIIGGESGPKARPCDVAWIRSLVTQCREAGTACFVKQLGAKPVQPDPRVRDMRRPGWMGTTTLDLRDKKGGDIEEFPADLRVREFPEVRA
jgi:protein gp37